MSQSDARWIWYPGDLELFHGMKQNFSRVERGCAWPAFWKSEGFRQRVVYRREYELPCRTTFTVYGAPGLLGYVQVNGDKYPLNRTIECEGHVSVAVHAACIGCVPAVYVDGEIICSDTGWTVDDYCQPPVPAASNRYFTHPEQRVDT